MRIQNEYSFPLSNHADRESCFLRLSLFARTGAFLYNEAMENLKDEKFSLEHDPAFLKLSPFAQDVLAAMDADDELLEEVLYPKGLAPICKAGCMNEFVKRIESAKENGETILIAGDYDCDGMMATAILHKALGKLGLAVRYHIPDRIREGYGLSTATVEKAKEDGASLIITVDNGVAAHAALEKARELEVDVIVTDHHLIAKEPDCLSLVHPQRMGDVFADLCGAGVAFECARAIGCADIDQLIYAAIASISDCMSVRRQTRSIIQQGLRALNTTREIHLAPFVRSFPVRESDVAFQIAPKINAIGRLSDRANANCFINYLSCMDENKVLRYASKVEELNSERKAMTRKAFERALVEVSPFSKVILISTLDLHEGIVGLVAGQLSSKFEKPAIVCTNRDGLLKCSMRAPEGMHCMEILEGFDGYLSIGGHAQAAGFSLKADRMEEFREYLQKKAAAMPMQAAAKKTIPLDPYSVDAQSVQSLDALRPFGSGFELPPFEMNHPSIVSSFDLSEGLHRKFRLASGLQAIHFNQTSMDAAAPAESIEKMIGTLSVSVWNGWRSAEFLIDEIVYANLDQTR